eukprot:8902470-Pyramimonas_sp.AAC.1
MGEAEGGGMGYDNTRATTRGHRDPLDALMLFKCCSPRCAFWAEIEIPRHAQRGTSVPKSQVGGEGIYARQ